MKLHQKLRSQIQAYFFVFVILLFLGLALSWKWGALQNYLDIDLVVTTLKDLASKINPIFTIVGFSLAAAMVVPMTFLSLVSIISFGPLLGISYILIGGCFGSAISFGIGRLLGSQVVRKIAGKRINEVSQMLARKGIIASLAMRFVPIVPFAISNMIAGISHIRLRDFLIGSTIGLLPSSILIAIFVDNFLILFSKKEDSNMIPLAIVVMIFLFFVVLMIRKILKQN